MGTRSVNDADTPANSTASLSWKLDAETAKRTQGLVASSFNHLPVAVVLFLALPKGAGGAWLQTLSAAVTISDATGSRADQSAAVIAFTNSGLVEMKLPSEVLATFSLPFQEGMHQSDRRRRLRDSEDPLIATVIAGGAQWSGNIPNSHGQTADSTTPITVHSALLIYAQDDAALDAQVNIVEASLTVHQVTICHCLRLSLRSDAQGITREHFGFADGFSQPVPTGVAITNPVGPEAAALLQWHGVKAGEIMLGHENIHGEPAPGPVLASNQPGNTAGLTSTGAPQGFLNLGLNGSYLVIRELRQDVAKFWQSMDAAAQTMNAQSPASASAVDGKWMAERVIGRTLDGDVLRPEGEQTPYPDKGQCHMGNNFGYAHNDLHGFGCPLGAHIRRANPRDSMPSRDGAAPDLAAVPELLAAANAHRILRRGRKFGPDIVDPRQDDGKVRGLLFMCLNSDLVRHFEFVQQNWLLNPSFATLFDETDPLLGPPGRMTIPACPIRQRPRVQTYVQMAGGEYFFLPSLPALDYLGSLR